MAFKADTSNLPLIKSHFTLHLYCVAVIIAPPSFLVMLFTPLNHFTIHQLQSNSLPSSSTIHHGKRRRSQDLFALACGSYIGGWHMHSLHEEDDGYLCLRCCWDFWGTPT